MGGNSWARADFRLLAPPLWQDVIRSMVDETTFERYYKFFLSNFVSTQKHFKVVCLISMRRC